jgi:signal transduction histidine kinase/CheY-like chemotaxis protein
MTATPEISAQDPEVRPDHNLEQLKVANYYLRVALDQVPEGVILLEAGPLEGRGPKIMFSNAPAACLAGVEPGRGLRGLHLADLVANESDLPEMLAAFQTATEQGAHECECALQSNYGGAAKPHRWRVRAVYNSMKRLLNFTLTLAPVEQSAPVVEAKPEDLDTQSERLKTENLAALAKGIAHDINNLLVPVMARLSDVLPHIPQESPLAKELGLAFAGLRRAKQYTSQVVKAAKAKPGKCEPTDICQVVRDSVQLSQSGANVAVNVSVEEGLCWAIADSVKVAQVLQNLVMNGIQAMPNGGHMEVEARNIIISPGQDILAPGMYVELTVRDRGTGISPENLNRLFSEVFSTKPDGNGIGLTTCKRFIEEHNGDIRVRSTVGVGTEFRVLLPGVPPLKKSAASDTVNHMPIPLRKGSGTVLIVDDEMDLRAIASNILLRCGYRVYECESGEDAIESYQKLSREGETPDVVLMDLTLRGGMSGTEATMEILRRDPEAKIVVTSGSVSDEVETVFLDQGFIGSLPKPYEAGELSHAVHRYVTMRERALAHA